MWPDLLQAHQVGVRSLDGFSKVEFRRGADGPPYLMEINPRMTADLGLAVSAGIDVPYMLYQWAIGDKIDPMKPYRPGRWMRYLGGDRFRHVQQAVRVYLDAL